MGDKTNISYADHSWSPWLGCEPVSPGCAHCYASAISKRAGRGAYRRGMPRTLTKDWEKPKRWDRQSRQCQTFCDEQAKPRVLVSMCDPFDDQVPIECFAKFRALIDATPELTWLLLTKRPENIIRRLDEEVGFSHGEGWTSLWTQGDPPENVWLGVSVENQEMADKRIPILLSIPAKLRWVSYEPMIGPVDWFPFLGWRAEREAKGLSPVLAKQLLKLRDVPGVDWIVAGGESGPGRRPMEIDWMRSVADQCKADSVAFYCKQDSHRLPGQQGRIPDDLWSIKQFPKP